jgi:hypothetical protein
MEYIPTIRPEHRNMRELIAVIFIRSSHDKSRDKAGMPEQITLKSSHRMGVLNGG